MSKRWVRGIIASVGAALLVVAISCGDGGSDAPAGGKVCDPLATTPAKATKLGDILGVGRDDDGTLYVADNVASEPEPRVFIAEDDVLLRHRVAGSGDGTNDGVRLITLLVEADPEDITLAIEIAKDRTRMATVAGDGETKGASFDELEKRHDLEVLDADAVADVPVRELPKEIEIEYVAKAESGELILVIRPRDGWDYDDFRLFYGKPPRLLECAVDSVSRQLDGGSTQIDFELGSTTVIASFPVRSTPEGGFEPGPASLLLDDKTVALERLPAKRSALGGAELLCLD